MRRLAGRVAVVTGAASGIGRALALALAERGCALALVDVDAAGLAALERELAAASAGASREVRVSTHVADVADRARMAALPGEVVAAHGAVHVLVNNAGVATLDLLEEHPLEDFDWLFGINFFGVLHGCAFFLPHLRAQDEAHIVNVSSMFGFVGLPRNAAYCASKAAVRSLSESLQAELAGSNVCVTSVHPGGVKTSIIRSARGRDEGVRAEVQGFFDRRARAPEVAARRIVRAIERGSWRIRIGAESVLADWAKRIAPVAAQRAIAARFRRAGGAGPAA